MDMGTSTMSMAGMPTATSSGASHATSTGMSMHMSGNCKISMLWNWYTIDSCFISRSWHITSKGMFAGFCIGVVLLVMFLEFLRRLAKEYDRYLFRQYKRSQQRASVIQSRVTGKDGPGNGSNENSTTVTTTAPSTSRPNIFQQAVRATLHMMQFAVAYFIMMLAMYYNGYCIICIIAGAWLGAFVFSWESVSLVSSTSEEATVCCG